MDENIDPNSNYKEEILKLKAENIDLKKQIS